MAHKIFLDAENTPMGRVASFAAKQALGGNEVVILNSEKAIISGRREKTIEDFKFIKSLNSINPTKGPFLSKSPEKIMKRCVRGMVPDYRLGRGKVAFKLVKCYVGIPKEFEKEKLTKLEITKPAKAITVNELSKLA